MQVKSVRTKKFESSSHNIQIIKKKPNSQQIQAEADQTACRCLQKFQQEIWNRSNLYTQKGQLILVGSGLVVEEGASRVRRPRRHLRAQWWLGGAAEELRTRGHGAIHRQRALSGRLSRGMSSSSTAAPARMRLFARENSRFGRAAARRRRPEGLDVLYGRYADRNRGN